MGDNPQRRARASNNSGCRRLAVRRQRTVPKRQISADRASLTNCPDRTRTLSVMRHLATGSCCIEPVDLAAGAAPVRQGRRRGSRRGRPAGSQWTNLQRTSRVGGSQRDYAPSVATRSSGSALRDCPSLASGVTRPRRASADPLGCLLDDRTELRRAVVAASRESRGLGGRARPRGVHRA